MDYSARDNVGKATLFYNSQTVRWIGPKMAGPLTKAPHVQTNMTNEILENQANKARAKKVPYN